MVLNLILPQEETVALVEPHAAPVIEGMDQSPSDEYDMKDVKHSATVTSQEAGRPSADWDHEVV